MIDAGTPEPASIVSGGLGLILISGAALFRRFRKRAAEPGSGKAEPLRWARPEAHSRGNGTAWLRPLAPCEGRDVLQVMPPRHHRNPPRQHPSYNKRSYVANSVASVISY